MRFDVSNDCLDVASQLAVDLVGCESLESLFWNVEDVLSVLDPAQQFLEPCENAFYDQHAVLVEVDLPELLSDPCHRFMHELELEKVVLSFLGIERSQLFQLVQ